MLASSLCLLTACSVGPRNFENDNDRLREQVMTLTTQCRLLQEQLAATDKALEAAELRDGVTLPQGVRRPVCGSIAIDRFSTITQVDAKPAARIYLQTLDTRGRFVQTVGEVKVTITAAAPGSDAVTLGVATFDAAAFDAAYRSGLTGTHYTLIVPLTRQADPATQTVTASIALHDLLHGTTLQTQAPLH